jgi:hypothetical protein
MESPGEKSDNTKPYFPLAGGADDGWSKDDSATATCYCGAVQLAFVRLISYVGETFSLLQLIYW